MLQKMRWRFIFAAMLAFFAVISLIAVLVNIVNTISVTKRIDQSVESILSMEARAPGEWTPEKEEEPNRRRICRKRISRETAGF